MFGIKAKKNKKIKELQKDIDKLKRMLEPTTFTIEKNSNVNTFTSEFVVPIETINNMSEERIKRILASKMVDVIADNMEIEHTQDNFRQLKIYKAKLEILERSELYDN